MNFARINHIALIVSDYERSKNFYTKIVGFPIITEEYRAERNSFKLNLKINDETNLELFSFPHSPERPSYPEACGLRHIAFTVPDIKKARTELENQGIILEEIRTEGATAKQFFFFHDPDGLPIEVHEP